jgi:N,N'-diacetyllegionaminate synthase
MSRTFIVTDCGINANGNIELAKNQIDLAVACGVDAVKFQVYNSEKLHGINSPVYKDAKRGEFSYDHFRVLADYCPIEWFASGFDTGAIDLLDNIGVQRHKVASRSLTDWELLNRINKSKIPVIMSTGNHDTGAIQKALSILKDCKVTLLYCVPIYPTKIQDLNFNRMTKIGELFKLPIGFSDHTTGIWASIEAVRLGATVIEKHFTISRSLAGCDQIVSLEPHEMKMMVKSIRQCEAYRNEL